MVRLRWFLLPLLLLVGGCRKEEVAIEPKSAPTVSALRTFSVDLGNIGELYDTTVASDECVTDSGGVGCTARNGRIDRWISWQIPFGPDSDGDGTKFRRIGRWKNNGRFETILAELGHDSPSFLFWNREAGGWIEVHPGTDSIYVSDDLGAILVLGWSPESIQRWDYWKNLANSPQHFVCTPPTGRLVVDSFPHWIGPNLQLVSLNIANLDSTSLLGCRETLPIFDTVVADYMVKPQNLSQPADSTSP
jgi:hypothetical protein